jgi:hypothetical protein
MERIAATFLARNTRSVLNRTESERQSILITRGRTVIARLSPDVGTMAAAQALANFNIPTYASLQASLFKR